MLDYIYYGFLQIINLSLPLPFLTSPVYLSIYHVPLQRVTRFVWPVSLGGTSGWFVVVPYSEWTTAYLWFSICKFIYSNNFTVELGSKVLVYKLPIWKKMQLGSWNTYLECYLTHYWLLFAKQPIQVHYSCSYLLIGFTQSVKIRKTVEFSFCCSAMS